MGQKPSWQIALERALVDNRAEPHSRFMQLATVNEQAKPANRTLVFRGFYPQSCSLMMVTDHRSDKLAQIKHNSAAEICWYFSRSREQFRIAGELQWIGCEDEQQDVRRQLWQNLSEQAKSQFAWPAPAKPRRVDLATHYQQTVKQSAPPANNFTLLLLVPQSVDHLLLNGEPQNRYYHQRQQNDLWQSSEITP